ncbi:MarR family transcriptional regulator [Nocardioides hungaricus]
MATAEARTMYLVKQLESLLRSRIEQVIRPRGLTVPQYTALSILEVRPGLSSAELARRTFVSAQAANELVNALRAKGLIVRSQSAQHARLLEITLSDRGHEVLSECAAEIRALEDRMLTGLDPGRTEGFRDDILSCIDALRAESRS